MKKPFMTLKETVLLSIVGLTVILNGVLMGLLGPPRVLDELRIIAWIAFGMGCALVILSILTLRTKGTKAVIDSGVYAVVRHPMYLGGIFFYVYMILWAQHWIVAILAIVGMVCVYFTMKIEEERCIEKFGDVYRQYMRSVPRANLLAGLIWLLRRGKRG
jgi:protein-S-isoprenylcysteine O-methyltransferase Ste14